MISVIRLGYGTRNNYPSVFYHAHLELVAVNTFAIASISIMTCLIVDRYIFIFFPVRIRSRNARKNIRSFILCSFILGFAVSSFYFFCKKIITAYESSNFTEDHCIGKRSANRNENSIWTARRYRNSLHTAWKHFYHPKCFMECIHLDHGSRATTLSNYNSSFTE